MKRIVFALVCLTSAGVSACATDGTPWSGEALPGEPLVLHTANEGVHPDRSVLDDPANPFADGELTDATIWQLQSNGGAVAAFYAWATANARGATGERQYYAALDLKTVFERGLAADGDLPLVKDVAIRGFQSVLTYFPDAVTWDISGTIPYELATPSVMAILELGGTVDGWVLVMTPDGRTVAVPR
ncbi:MAG TPA: hypothetical protein VM261_10660 [Kofleriaceae bacterium]|nr:hypothetical protein [Kofleriaceae bacterium]